MNKYNINLDKLDNLSIFQLREVGNKIGVKQPTQLKSRELKDEIIAIVTGIKEPYRKEKSGRPHKEIISDTEWDKLIGFAPSVTISTNDTFTPQFYRAEVFSPIASLNRQLNGQKLKGYIIENEHGLILAVGESNNLNIQNLAKIQVFTKGVSLIQPGDKVECKISYNSDSPCVDEICAINDRPIQNCFLQ